MNGFQGVRHDVLRLSSACPQLTVVACDRESSFSIAGVCGVGQSPSALQLSRDGSSFFTCAVLSGEEHVSMDYPCRGKMDLKLNFGEGISVMVVLTGQVRVISSAPVLLPLEKLLNESPSEHQVSERIPSALKRKTSTTQPRRSVSFSNVVERSLGDGLIYRVLKPGRPYPPFCAPARRVKLSINGTEKVLKLDTNQLCEGLNLAVKGMSIGEQRQVTVPASLDDKPGLGSYTVTFIGPA